MTAWGLAKKVLEERRRKKEEEKNNIGGKTIYFPLCGVENLNMRAQGTL